MACSLFGISNDIAMQVVGVGFIIGVIQDSVETCLNSASDVEFAATAEYHAWLKQGRQLPAFMYSKKERQQLRHRSLISPDFSFSFNLEGVSPTWFTHAGETPFVLADLIDCVD